MAKSMTLIVKTHALSHLTPTPYDKLKTLTTLSIAESPSVLWYQL